MSLPPHSLRDLLPIVYGLTLKLTARHTQVKQMTALTENVESHTQNVEFQERRRDLN